jgi:hypothetical protein
LIDKERLDRKGKKEVDDEDQEEQTLSLDIAANRTRSKAMIPGKQFHTASNRHNPVESG